MYCIQCGVKLADSEQVCPLCGTVPYHPDLPRQTGEPLYPAGRKPHPQVRSQAAQIVTTALFLLPVLVCLQVDLLVNRTVTWSGYVIGALVLSYVVLVLPGWFRKPNPVILLPCDFLALGMYLLYMDLQSPGQWFWSFGLPLTGFCCAVVTGVVALVRYLRRGHLYIFGGACILSGLAAPVLELLICRTFHRSFVAWSCFPLTALILLGGTLIFLALNRRARAVMERKLFV